MKKYYFAPELEFLRLETSDIITTSGVIGGDPETGGEGNTGPTDNWE